MARKKTFNILERKLQQIPTWAFVSCCVMFLTMVAFWIQPEENLDSVRDLIRVAFYNAESIAIAAAVALYFKEIPDRKEKRHFEAWQIIDSAVGVETSYARYKALQDLNKDGVTLVGIDLPKADLRNINFADANLKRANLCGVDLKGANLQNADLTNATLINAHLDDADLTRANLTNADLTGSILTNAKLNWANLTQANLTNAKISDRDLINAKLCQTILPQDSRLNRDRDCPC